jgi:hypothetical protein
MQLLVAFLNPVALLSLFKVHLTAFFQSLLEDVAFELFLGKLVLEGV